MKLITTIEVEKKYSEEEIVDIKSLSDEQVSEYFVSWENCVIEMINENFEGDVSIKVAFELKEEAK